MSRAVLTARCAAIASLAALTVAGCGGGGGDQRRPAPTRQERQDLGVVAIDAGIGRDHVRSAGVVIDADRGLVLTAAHAVWGARSLAVTTGLGVLHGRIVARAACEDLALLETQPSVPGLLRLGAIAPAAPAAGASVTALVRGSALRLRVQGGQAPAQLDPRLAQLPAALPLAGSVAAQATGAPIVDRRGRLMGMVDSAGGRAVVVPWSAVRRRLAELRPGPQQIYVGWKDQYRCLDQQNAFAAAAHPGFQPSDARLRVRVPATRLPGAKDPDKG